MVIDWPIFDDNNLFALDRRFVLLLVRGSEEVVHRNSRSVALWSSLFTFAMSLLVFWGYDQQQGGYQFEDQGEWLVADGIGYHMGVDGISLAFLMLTTFLVPLAILASWDSIKHRMREYMAYFLLLETLMIGTFCALDLVTFLSLF